jgi:hypothetical protein
MISFIRTAAIAPGKGPAAAAFAAKILDYYKTHYGTQLELMRPIGGNPNRIAWVARYESLAAFDAVSTKSQSDQKYLELLGTAADLFTPGSVRDEIWRSA